MRRSSWFAVAVLGVVVAVPARTRAVPPPAPRAGANIVVQASSLPAEAQPAFNLAVDTLAGLIESTQTIHVIADWSAELAPGVLGIGTPINRPSNRPNSVPDTLVPVALANHLANSDPSILAEIQISLNNSVTNWDYSTNGTAAPDKYSLATVVLRELMHAIAFDAGSATVSGGLGYLTQTEFTTFPDLYSRFTVTSAGQPLLTTFSNQSPELAAALQAPSGVFWNGALAIAANGGTRPRLHTPATWLQRASYVNLDEAVYPQGSANALMTPTLALGEVVLHPGPVALAMLRDMGWPLVDPCAPSFNPASASVPRVGGTFTVAATIPNGCNWTASSNNGFLHVTGGTPGSGSGVVNYTVDTNPGPAARQGTLTIDGATFTVAQAGNTIAASPMSMSFKGVNNGGTLNPMTPPQQVTVNFDGTGGTTWNVTANRPWVQITNGSGTGSGTFTIGIINPGNVLNGVASASARLTLTATNVTETQLTLGVDLSLTSSGSLAGPYGQVDLPAQNAPNQQGAIGLTGWVLDDVGVQHVKVYRPCLPFDAPASCNPVGGNSLVYVADAAFLAGARPDVEAVSAGVPLNYRAGWGVQILSNMLPHIPNQQLYGGQGTFPFYVYATDYDGHSTLLGRSTADHTPTSVQVTNDTIAKPFGTLDTPGLGETISGTKAVFGWVLTPDTNTVADGTDILMATNGSGIVVYIDSMATAIVAYNQCRGTVGNPPSGGNFCNDDVANIFGNLTPAAPLANRFSNPTRYRNLDANRGAIGAYVMNTTLLANGLHTIAWGVADSAGRGEGIGSRFFTVLNGGSGVVAESLTDLLEKPVVSRGSAKSIETMRPSSLRLSSRAGFNPSTPMTELRGDQNGVRALSIGALDRIELAFAMPVARAYLVANGELRDLPIGATLDRRTGVFAWAPPLGYFGTYRLAFIVGAERVDVDVTVGEASGSKRDLRRLR